MRTAAITVSSVLCLLLARAGEPCSCNPSRPNFWQLAHDSQVVVVAQVTRQLPASSPAQGAFEARVVEVVKGTEQRTSLTFPAPMTDTCSVGAHGFPVGATYAFILPAAEGFSRCWNQWIEIDWPAPTTERPKLTIEQLRARLAGLPMPPGPIRMIPSPPPPPSPTPTPLPPTPAYGVIRPNTARGSGSCPCRPDEPGFWELARHARVVVVAEVTRQLSISIPAEWAFEAHVIEVVKGTEARTTLTFPAPQDNGSCTVTALSFPVGSIHAFVLPPDDPIGFRQCQPRWLRLEGAKDDPANVKLEVDQLRALLAANPNR